MSKTVTMNFVCRKDHKEIEVSVEKTFEDKVSFEQIEMDMFKYFPKNAETLHLNATYETIKKTPFYKEPLFIFVSISLLASLALLVFSYL